MERQYVGGFFTKQCLERCIRTLATAGTCMTDPQNLFTAGHSVQVPHLQIAAILTMPECLALDAVRARAQLLRSFDEEGPA